LRRGFDRIWSAWLRRRRSGPGSGRFPGFRRRIRQTSRPHEVDEVANGAVGFEWMTQGFPRIDSVSVSPAALGHAQQALILQVAYNLLNGAFGYPNASGDIPQPCLGITGEKQQYMAVITEQGPIAQGNSLFCRFETSLIMKYISCL
jgi:hypothetical protein